MKWIDVKHDENAVKILIDFVEGRIDIASFKNEFENNFIIKEALSHDPGYFKSLNYSENFVVNPNTTAQYLEMKEWDTHFGQLSTWGAVQRFLDKYGYRFIPTKIYEEKFNFLLDIQPNWLDIEDENFLIENVINKIPENLRAKSEKVKWCKEKIKELFKYDKTPPRWVQHAQWPIVNGKPLAFKRQSKETLDNERVDFYFYDPDNGEETVVTQYY